MNNEIVYCVKVPIIPQVHRIDIVDYIRLLLMNTDIAVGEVHFLINELYQVQTSETFGQKYQILKNKVFNRVTDFSFHRQRLGAWESTFGLLTPEEKWQYFNLFFGSNAERMYLKHSFKPVQNINIEAIAKIIQKYSTVKSDNFSQ